MHRLPSNSLPDRLVKLLFNELIKVYQEEVIRMTIQELQQKLDAIPPTGIINRARRAAIIALINQLLTGQVKEG